jgi:hypothetical protein
MSFLNKFFGGGSRQKDILDLNQDSSRWRGWILPALLAPISCAAPLVASDALPANPLAGGVARADAELGAQEAPLGTQAPVTDASQAEPDVGTTRQTRSGRTQLGTRPEEVEQGPKGLARKQKEILLKMDFEKMKHDAAELATLAQSLQEDLEKSNEHILSMKIVEKAP